MPEFHSASAPRTDLKLLTGIGGGQVFGLRPYRRLIQQSNFI